MDLTLIGKKEAIEFMLKILTEWFCLIIVERFCTQKLLKSFLILLI
ncbi:hypothetical protein HL733_001649 [Campylobacter upsaliensis]|nr:hypothetical protein [Campylobacter upsaliensis]EIL6894892.1 hypothetical protein [Campylobacter upsaliensis]EJC0906807.1 hypothetical protein [Campylobacter upsaliensis]